LGQVIDRVVQLLTPQANQKNIQIVREYPTAGEGGAVGKWEADPALLVQALYNLVENAIKYTPMAGKIFVGLRIGSGQRRVVRARYRHWHSAVGHAACV
jgi:signal transduction histidine kinase